ncbi:MAG: translocation/assembly module TamB domain-containing protein [Burkholderiales bacterium]|jgi:translocation and assembly module TamB|nr:translocation/assembly module TamB domain-containing protein [Burkholderiales bacterium]
MLRRVLLALLALAVVATAGLFFAARSETVLAWGLARVTAATGGRLVFEGVQGAIVGAPVIGRIRYEDEDVRVEARDAKIAWSPLALAFGKVEVASLAAASVTIRTQPSEGAASLPDAIGLPLPVHIGRAEIARLAIEADGPVVAFEDVRLGYEGDATAHRLTDVSGRAFGATIRGGRYELGARPPFAIAGEAAAERPAPPLAVALDAKFGGTLAAMTFDVGARSPAWTEARGVLRIAPFADAWLAEARVQIEGLDLAKADPAWPKTAASVQANASSGAAGAIEGAIDAVNSEPGPLDASRVPLASVKSRYTLGADDRLVFEDVVAGLAGGGAAAGTVTAGGERATLALAVRGLDLARFHSRLRQTALAGKIDADLGADVQSAQATLSEAGIALAFDASRRGDEVELRKLRAAAGGGELLGSGRLSLAGEQPFSAKASFARFDPRSFGDYPAASLSGEAILSGRVASPWRVDADAKLANSRFRDVPLSGGGKVSVSADRVTDANLALALGANRATARGALGRAGDVLAIEFDAPKLAEVERALSGRASGTVELRGALASPAAAFSVRGENLSLRGDVKVARLAATGEASRRPDAPLALDARAEQLSIRGTAVDRAEARVAGTLARHAGEASATGAGFDARIRAAGSWDDRRGWAGEIASFENRGDYPATLKAPALLEIASGRGRLGPLDADVAGGTFRVREARWEDGRLASSGAFERLPAAPLIALAGAGATARGTLTLAGEWAVTASPRLNGTVAVRREAGDIELVTDPVFPLGLSEVQLDARFVEDRLAATLAVRGTGVGDLRGRVDLAPAATPQGLALAPGSPLEATLTGEIASLKALARLFPSDVIADGSMRVALRAGGTVANPSITGTLSGENLRIEAPPYGVDWRDGRLQAELTPDALQLGEFVVRAGQGTLKASGRVPRTPGNEGAKIEWRADRFLALARPDRRLVASGAGTATYSGRRVRLEGALRADEGTFEFGRSALPELGDDVVIVGQPRAPRRGFADVPLDLDLDLDFGDRLRIAGYGLEGILGGKLRIDTPRGEPLGHGTVYIRQGTYRAYGQNLKIERGQLVFDGPLDNPALRIEAWRRNQQVAAGVDVSGTVRAPRVRIVSEPSVPEGEALSWLVLGRPPDTSNKADLAALQVAAAALFYGDDRAPVTRQIARAIGLDDITIGTGSVAGASSAGGTLQGQVIAFGKRLSDRVYLTYEQAIAATGSVVKLDYLLTQRISLRAETGTRTGGGIHYRYTFD